MCHLPFRYICGAYDVVLGSVIAVFNFKSLSDFNGGLVWCNGHTLACRVVCCPMSVTKQKLLLIV